MLWYTFTIFTQRNTRDAMNYLMLYYAIAILSAFAIYYAVPLKHRWIVLLTVSLVFYAITSTYLTVFAVTTSIGVYFSARGIQKRNDKDTKELPESEKKKIKTRNKASMVITILFNLGILAFLKYFNFLGGSFCSFLNLFKLKVHFRMLKLLLPLGISYYTLSAIGYLIDVHRKKYQCERNFFKILLFLTFFVSVIEGPILRYGVDGQQITEGHTADYKSIAHGFQRILWGLFKKLVIADRVFLLVRTVGGDPHAYSGLASLFFILGYTLQLYADFSGFMDMALGAAQLFGIKLTENFRRPFFASGAQEFWQRWHITLGIWFKEYVFYSVAFSPSMLKFGKAIKKKHKNHFTKILPTGIALLCVWLCNGIWHGPQWNYIVYGLYYFVIIFSGMLAEPLFNKLYKKMKISNNAIGLKIMRHVRTLLIIFIGEAIFGANTLSDALYILGSVFKPYHGSLLALGLDWKEFLILGIGVAVMITVSALNEKNVFLTERIDTLALPLRWTIYLAAVVIVVIFGAYGAGYASAPFMYGNF